MACNPYEAPSAVVADSQSMLRTVSTSTYAKAWLVFFLVATVGGGLLGAVVGGAGGVFLGRAGASLGTIQLVGLLGGGVVGIPVSFLTFRWCVARYIVAPLIAGPGSSSLSFHS